MYWTQQGWLKNGSAAHSWRAWDAGGGMKNNRQVGGEHYLAMPIQPFDFF